MMNSLRKYGTKTLERTVRELGEKAEKSDDQAYIDKVREAMNILKSEHSIAEIKRALKILRKEDKRLESFSKNYSIFHDAYVQMYLSDKIEEHGSESLDELELKVYNLYQEMYKHRDKILSVFTREEVTTKIREVKIWLQSQ